MVRDGEHHGKTESLGIIIRRGEEEEGQIGQNEVKPEDRLRIGNKKKSNVIRNPKKREKNEETN